MKYILSAEQMAYADHYTQEHFHVPSLVLMERAALAVVSVIEERIAPTGSSSGKAAFCMGKASASCQNGTKGGFSVGILCGSGNNGGDGMAVARLLSERGYTVSYVLLGKEEKLSPSAKVQYDILRAYGMAPVGSAADLSACDLLIDAVFGTGLSRPVREDMAAIFALVNDFPMHKLAIDIPSGIHATTGAVMGTAIQCDLTVTFAYEKLGQHLFPGRSYTGELICMPIGIGNESLPRETSILTEAGEQARLIKASDASDAARLLPKRTADSHKGTYGRVLVIAGSKGMAGAAYLAAKAACRTGAGLVKIFTEEANRVILQELLPEAMLATYDAYDADQLKKELSWATAVLIGPGLGTTEEKKHLLSDLLGQIRVPLVCDADALALLADTDRPASGDPGTQAYADKADPLRRLRSVIEAKDVPVILTPHLGEMSRLTGQKVSEIQKALIAAAEDAAKTSRAAVVLKSSATITAIPDRGTYLNLYGNHGMATGGSGDVLSGILAGLFAQGCALSDTAVLGVLLHSLAGDAAKETTGARAMKAEDILTGLANVLHTLEADAASDERRDGQGRLSMQDERNA